MQYGGSGNANALKRAEELIAVGQSLAALQALHEVVMSKRSRNTPLVSMEPIMLKYVELCVDLRKGKMVKEGLHQYKNIAQNTSVNTIELVINRFLELAEEKVTEAQAKADKITLDAIDDLEASETPESIMLSTVSGEQSKDRTDRSVVTPWLKFLWEAYRTVLDTLRNNVRLEVLYQSVSNQAFQFCLTYGRKTEFRRLCDILRNHLQNIAKYAHQAHSINLNDPDTLQRHLDARFNQLNAAVELELWQEAFKSVEDIHTLLSMSKRPPKPVMMANYYDKLTKIFMVSENYLFHAASWNRYSNIVRAINKNLTDEEQIAMANTVLLSALAIPVITTSRTRPGYVEADEQRIQKLNRLSSLLGLPQHPSRSALLKEALNKNILRRVRPEIRDLYNILEVQFHPLSICKKINPIMTQLAEDPELAKYVRPLHQVILTRLLQQLSQVYTTIKLDFVLELASFPEPYKYDASTIEKFIMNGCKKGELSIRIDHATQSMTFETDLFAPPKDTITEGPKLQSSPADLMRTQLSRLGKCLHTTVQMIDPSVQAAAVRAKEEAFARALAGAEEEHKNTLARKQIIEQRKEHIETELARAEREAAQERALIAQQKAAAEQKRREEEQKRREAERLRKIQEEIQRDQAKKIADEIAAKTGMQLKPEEIENADVETLLNLKVSRLQSEQKELNERLRNIAKRLDHTERAYRKEEIPLLEKDYEKQQKNDLAYYEAARKAQLKAAAAKHEEDMKIKSRVGRIFDDYNAFKKNIESQRQEVYRAKQQAIEEKIAQEKQKRIEQYRAQREEMIRQREEEEARQKAQEEQERREREEQEAREAEKAAEAEKRKAEEEERQSKLDEIARLQREKEAAIEAKLSAKSTTRAAPPPTDRWVPPSRRDPAREPESPSNDRFGRSEGTWRRAGPPSDDRFARRGGPSERPTERPSERPSERPTETPSSSASGPPRFVARGGAATGGGWREREAAKRAAAQNQPEGEKKDQDGFVSVRRGGKW
ncbi:eukaryotic translation initiation factor 3 subunit A [Umbelopsis sp. WA50703]